MTISAFKFTLSGKTAIFKKPEVNAYAYFTYNNIHKIALLGMLGAILGLKGYPKNKDELKEPLEFYEKLKGLKVSIVPHSDLGGHFVKKIHVFNNSVGYASDEAGGNLIVREQWLENPKWDIYLLNDGAVDSNLFHKLCSYLSEGKCTYIPYLGKNEHYANISDCSNITLEKGRTNVINSLFIKSAANIKESIFDDDSDFPKLFSEVMPVSLVPEHGFYAYDEFYFTNYLIETVADEKPFYLYEGRTLFFF